MSSHPVTALTSVLQLHDIWVAEYLTGCLQIWQNEIPGVFPFFFRPSKQSLPLQLWS